MTIQPVLTPSCPQGPVGTSQVSPTAQISCRPTSQRCWEGTHTGSSRSLWSTGKWLCGRMQVSGWKCCADGDCWAALVQDRGSSTTNTNVLAGCGSSGSPERPDQFFMPFLASWLLTSNQSGIWGSGQSPMYPKGVLIGPVPPFQAFVGTSCLVHPNTSFD